MLKDIPKVNTWLQETTLLQKIATCNPSSKCHWWSCINVAGLFVFVFFSHSGRVTHIFQKERMIMKKITSLLHKIAGIPKAQPCPGSLGSTCRRINRMSELGGVVGIEKMRLRKGFLWMLLSGCYVFHKVKERLNQCNDQEASSLANHRTKRIQKMYAWSKTRMHFAMYHSLGH